MKLKYYMRGLGIGIILTTLILTIGGSKEKLSDQEIMKQAAALGMEMKDESNENLNKVLENMELTPAPSEAPTLSPSITPTVTPTAALTPTAEPTPTSEPTPTVKPTLIPTQKPTAVPTKSPASNADNEEKAGSKEKITFTVKSGMSSGQVSILLLEKGLVDNADDFNLYIVKAGKASTIHVGTYTLTKGASYDEIISALTEK